MKKKNNFQAVLPFNHSYEIRIRKKRGERQPAIQIEWLFSIWNGDTRVWESEITHMTNSFSVWSGVKNCCISLLTEAVATVADNNSNNEANRWPTPTVSIHSRFQKREKERERERERERRNYESKGKNLFSSIDFEKKRGKKRFCNKIWFSNDEKTTLLSELNWLGKTKGERKENENVNNDGLTRQAKKNTLVEIGGG